MNRREFAVRTGAASLLLGTARAQSPANVREILPGIYRLRFGQPEEITPIATRQHAPAEEQLRSLPSVPDWPLSPQQIRGVASKRGYLVSLPLAPGELVYGFGLQLQSFLQRGLKKKLRVNADPKIDTGDSHAPVPFYVTTAGYGVLVDTARYATFYCGNKDRKNTRISRKDSRDPERKEQGPAGSLPAEYSKFHVDEASQMLVEIPEAQGVDIYLFAGPQMRLAVQRYNLFSGSGAMPPRWGLGFWYRCDLNFTQEQVLSFSEQFREDKIACDVLGLEPGWQTHAYSCSFVWSDKFPNPKEMMARLTAAGYRLNVWEHAFTHPSSPIHQELIPVSGDYLVWDGLVPDFLDQTAREKFGAFHEREHVALGVSGYKLDECDNSDFTGNWSWPELSRFRSGADGEQMHSLFGLRYQDAINAIFTRRKTRSYQLVRSSGALAAPYPFVLYSDLYDHEEFIRGVANAGFSGLLWCPEVRDARDPEDLIRRLQTVVFSPLAMVNAWYIKNPPWKQVDAKKNNAGELAQDWQQTEGAVRELIGLRMQFIPYLYASFARYRLEGLPPFRALVLDYPADHETWTIDDQYMMGDSLLIAPVTAGVNERKIYLPEGEWFDFWTGKKLTGKQWITVSVPLERVPLFVKSGTLLPLAERTLHTGDPGSHSLSVRVYGDGANGATLYEDDGEIEPVFTKAILDWDAAKRSGSIRREGAPRAVRFTVRAWQEVND